METTISPVAIPDEPQLEDPDLDPDMQDAPADEPDPLADLKQAEETIYQETTAPIVAAVSQPLTFRNHGSYSTVETGILWIPPFIGPSPFAQPKGKPKPCKHRCPECGALHADKRKKG